MVARQPYYLFLESIVNYFFCKVSAVFMSGLDTGKVFDRVNHYSLFISLINNNIPLLHLHIIIYWHLNFKGCERWNGFTLSLLEIRSGIRQGRINSPGYFNTFINDLIVKLHIIDYGCYIANIFCGCILFADDILLLSVSLSKLQSMLDLCMEFAVENDIKFYHLKSHLFSGGTSNGCRIA